MPMTEREIREYVAANPDGPILGLMPESRAVQRKMGVTEFKPGLGWIKIPCDMCGSKGWIGLKQKAFKDANPKTPAVCYVCTIKHGADPSRVRHLGGRSGEYHMEDGTHFSPGPTG